MNASFFALVSGLALADSLNPFTVAAQAYLLGTPRPLARSLAFLIGTYATYLLGGILLLYGWSVLLAWARPLAPAWGLGAGEIALGAATACFGIWSLARARAGTPFRPPSALSVPATLAFGVASTVADLPSAMPYFAAVNRIAGLEAGWGVRLLWLAWYDLLYVLPCAVLVAAQALLAEPASAKLFGRVRDGVDWAFAKLLPPLLVVAGALLVADGARRLLALGS